MCDDKMAHVGRAECRRAQEKHDRQVREDAIRSVLGQQAAQPQLTATGYAQRVLAVCGGIVLLASVNFLAHALLIVLVTLFVAVSCTAAVVTVCRHGRRRAVIPAPLPAAPPRTVVTGVTVRPIGTASRAAVAAGERDRSRARR